MQRVLIIDDNPDIIDALDLLLSLHDYQVSTANTVKEAVLAVSNQQIDLIIQDMNFSQGTTSGAEGKDLFYQLKELSPNTPIIIITAWSQLETAIELVKAGAADYLPKPWDDRRLLDIIANHISQSVNSQSPPQSNLIYQSDAMTQLVAMAKKVAPSDISVLITGANGCGKERVADFIHQHSSRATQPFLKVNMGALPSELIESELFGVEKGAFTGANTSRAGRFEAANGGTIFLDEIGNLSLSGQMKLLRVLQTGQFERVGSTETINVDVRIISATNAELSQAIMQGEFREDLFYRLNVVELNLKPLVQRKDDILPLTYYFIGDDYQLSPQAQVFLLAHTWPGNVRELENMCKRAKVFSESELLRPEDFSPHANAPAIPSAHTTRLPELDEASHLQSVLDNHQWIISRAASELGISRQALYRRIEKHQLMQKG
ncbi:sigma-54-dependent Fis family transcriptional regulator [Alteromonadales bacterium alter-6D02]|nr:sigma-54-dependent Fis family transcriptional regulator [Alteromonadales bacterium alter-6D02]